MPTNDKKKKKPHAHTHFNEPTNKRTKNGWKKTQLKIELTAMAIVYVSKK